MRRFTQSQAVFLEATFVLLLLWLAFCFSSDSESYEMDAPSLRKFVRPLEIEQRLSFEIEQRLTEVIEQRLTKQIERMLNGLMKVHSFGKKYMVIDLYVDCPNVVESDKDREPEVEVIGRDRNTTADPNSITELGGGLEIGNGQRGSELRGIDHVEEPVVDEEGEGVGNKCVNADEDGERVGGEMDEDSESDCEWQPNDDSETFCDSFSGVEESSDEEEEENIALVGLGTYNLETECGEGDSDSDENEICKWQWKWLVVKGVDVDWQWKWLVVEGVEVDVVEEEEEGRVVQVEKVLHLTQLKQGVIKQKWWEAQEEVVTLPQSMSIPMFEVEEEEEVEAFFHFLAIPFEREMQTMKTMVEGKDLQPMGRVKKWLLVKQKGNNQS
ncbi:hypothetical protein RHGRI_030921 [Rhododendron griersonianum]|uniref:Uncharacterized protein n=1 Tax=Rhododendron griersonianum TaxID=479676 RepID=A0AAV6I9N7_9ERIC|nr:hypothetical protein RHGRI_030921 [Rhododendron griersonianum]